MTHPGGVTYERKPGTWSKLESAQELRVRGDDDRARRHEDRADCWGKKDPLRGKNPSREWDGDDVVPRGPEEVLDHLRVRRSRETDDLDDVARIVPQQDDSGRLDRDVGARADRDPHVRLGQRRSIVDTVTDHRDATSVTLQLLDNLGDRKSV